MRFQDFVARVSAQCGVPRDTVRDVVNAVFDQIKISVQAQQPVTIKNFGKFIQNPYDQSSIILRGYAVKQSKNELQ